MQEIQGQLFTQSTILQDLKELGIESGMTLMVHSSFKSLGSWVAGGPVAVILALEEALGETGTLVMPTHSNDLSDPEGWRNPPVPSEWWEEIREHMPPYDPHLTPLLFMGIIPELFRKQEGTMRSGHPHHSFAARGPKAASLIAGHALAFGLGENSPLARLYDAEGWILLLGVGHGNNTSIHLAEYRAEFSGKKQIPNKAPLLVDGVKQWVEFPDLELNSDDFVVIGEAFETETKQVRRGKVAGAEAILVPQRALVDYAVGWMERNR